MNKSKLREQETFSTDGGSFQFANEEEVKKFQVFLKLIETEHKEALTNQRKAILEEVRSKVKFTKSEIDLLLNLIADNEKEGSYYGNRRIYWANRYKIKQKLSLLEGKK